VNIETVGPRAPIAKYGFDANYYGVLGYVSPNSVITTERSATNEKIGNEPGIRCFGGMVSTYFNNCPDLPVVMPDILAVGSVIGAAPSTLPNERMQTFL
jgi:hypothetical protein